MHSVVFHCEFLFKRLKGGLDVGPLRAGVGVALAGRLLGFGGGLERGAAEVEGVKEGVVEEVFVV